MKFVHYELYLFSKYFLYLFDQARYGNDYMINLFTQLIIDFLLNPVTLVHLVNKSIDLMNEQELVNSRFRGPISSTGGDFYNKTKLMPLSISEEPQPLQMLFIHAAVIIIKDQWRSYLQPSLEDKN